MSFSYYQSEYHKSKIFKASIFLSGKASEPLKNLTSYFRLRKVNKELIEEINCRIKPTLLGQQFLNELLQIFLKD